MANEIKIIDNENRINNLQRIENDFIDNLFVQVNSDTEQGRVNFQRELRTNLLNIPNNNFTQDELKEIRILNQIRHELSNRAFAIDDNIVNLLVSKGISPEKIDLPLFFRAMRELRYTRNNFNTDEIDRYINEYKSNFLTDDENLQRRIMMSLLANNAPINTRSISFAESSLNEILELENLDDNAIFGLLRGNERILLRNIYKAVFSNRNSENPVDNSDTLENDIINALNKRNIFVSETNINTAKKFVFNFVSITNKNLARYNYLTNIPQNTDIQRTLNLAVGRFLAGDASNNIPVFLNNIGSNVEIDREFVPELNLMNARVNRENIETMRNIFNNIRDIPYARILNRDFNLGEILNYSDIRNYFSNQNQRALEEMGFNNTAQNNFAYNALFQNNLNLSPENIVQIKSINQLIRSFSPIQAAYIISQNENPLEIGISTLVNYINKFNNKYSTETIVFLDQYRRDQGNIEAKKIYNALYFARYREDLLNLRNLNLRNIMNFYENYEEDSGEIIERNLNRDFVLNQSFLNQINIDELSRNLYPERLEMEIRNNAFFETNIEELNYNFRNYGFYNYNINQLIIDYINQVLNTNPHTILWMQSNGIPYNFGNITLSEKYRRNMLVESIEELPPELLENNLSDFENGQSADEILKKMRKFLEKEKQNKHELSDILNLSDIENLILFQYIINENDERSLNLPILIGDKVCNMNLYIKSNFKNKINATLNIESENFKDVDFNIYMGEDNLELKILLKSKNELSYIKKISEDLKKYLILFSF